MQGYEKQKLTGGKVEMRPYPGAMAHLKKETKKNGNWRRSKGQFKGGGGTGKPMPREKEPKKEKKVKRQGGGTV